MRCYECGSEFTTTKDPTTIRVRGEEYEIDGITHYRCHGCGEELFDLAEAEELQRRANDEYRKHHGLLASSDVRRIRDGRGITQDLFERLIGSGAKTVTRWENGTVIHSGVADTLYRVIDRFPEVYDWLLSRDRPFGYQEHLPSMTVLVTVNTPTKGVHSFKAPTASDSSVTVTTNDPSAKERPATQAAA